MTPHAAPGRNLLVQCGQVMRGSVRHQHDLEALAEVQVAHVALHEAHGIAYRSRFGAPSLLGALQHRRLGIQSNNPETLGCAGTRHGNRQSPRSAANLQHPRWLLAAQQIEPEWRVADLSRGQLQIVILGMPVHFFDRHAVPPTAASMQGSCRAAPAVSAPSYIVLHDERYKRRKPRALGREITMPLLGVISGAASPIYGQP